MAQIDACLLGAGMYPGYERYWAAIQRKPDKPVFITGSPPTPAEIEWAHFASRTPHHVLSRTLTSALCPKTNCVRGLDDVAGLKQSGKDIYLVGGARTAAEPHRIGPGTGAPSSAMPLDWSSTERLRGGSLEHVPESGQPFCESVRQTVASQEREGPVCRPTEQIERSR